MKNNKRHVLMLVAILSCLGVGTFNTTTIQAMEKDNTQKMMDILNELQSLRMDLVGDRFSTDWNQINIFVTSSRNLTDLFRMQRQPNRDTIKHNLQLIIKCENALKAFAPPSDLAATVNPNAWAAINKSLALLSELKELVKATQY